ncbi:LOW QUALITY PROTEIN: hypothetical protein CIHG_10235 [Coccidioides immitis H538.4]|uniref:Uncharacterized protein n=1 Tax=Coccidioides immitis H538.4 TaxID=396776 RepID=A0A0J8S7R1_COCIT|nr:LOW QUALITY PROTEIN: hypothetical protein CIHG_10235 [Coccidioides immitis H538.4]
MTLSCNGWALRSLLHSTFFNPDVYCNLVGSWLEPAFEALEPILDAEDYTGLTILLTRRQPVLGPLWLGAILTGTATTILHAIRSGQWAVDLHAAAWTGTEQSFLTTKLSGPRAAKQSRINRDDECRLLFLTGCDGFSSCVLGSHLAAARLAIQRSQFDFTHDVEGTTSGTLLGNGIWTMWVEDKFSLFETNCIPIQQHSGGVWEILETQSSISVGGRNAKHIWLVTDDRVSAKREGHPHAPLVRRGRLG